jgi:hypothetical protein
MTAPLVVLDVNAWMNYFRVEEVSAPILFERRERLRSAVARGLVRPMLTVGGVSELAATSNYGHAIYSEMMCFAWEVCEARLLATEGERSKDEILWEGKLTLDRALVRADRRRVYRDYLMLDEEWARGVGALALQANIEDRAEEKTRRALTIEALDQKDADDAREAAEANDGRVLVPWREAIMTDDATREELSAGWALDEMVMVAMHAGGPFARNRLPDPRTLPSFYIPKVVHVKRIHAVLLEGESPTRTGLYDINALHDAGAYADLLVTDDDKLLKLAARCNVVRAIDFATWDDDLRVLLTP